MLPTAWYPSISRMRRPKSGQPRRSCQKRRRATVARRRFAGVALDILYDHFLLRHWEQFSDWDKDTFIRTVYQELQNHQALMPDNMAVVTRRMVEHDWFGAYQDLDNIGYALDRVASRIRFANRFTGIIDEIRANESELEEHFLAFFPELQAFANRYPESSHQA